MDEEFVSRLALNRIPGIGPAKYANLLKYFGAAKAVFAADRAELTQALGSSADSVSQICRRAENTGVEQDLKWLNEHPRHHICILNSENYPRQLAEIHQPPPVLFMNGDPGLLHSPQLAIVGSRNPTPGGVENAQRFAHKLAACGLTITSGLAIGIDGAAHKGALGKTRAGKTIAVCATGLDRIYPLRHHDLAQLIAEEGLLVSEFPVGTKPLRENFPRRNRLISGLSRGVLVIEAALKSGSLITARYAAEQGREVFAIPGSIHSPQSRGCHWLIKQGAKLVESTDDIAEELLAILPAITQDKSVPDSMPELHQLTDAESGLLKHIGYDPVSFDRLIERAGIPVEAMTILISQLEIRGYLEILPGGLYCRK